MSTPKRQIEAKLMKGLLDLVILQFLKSQPMHGYQIITNIRRNFGVYFGPSTIYPLLSALEEKGYIKSQWDLTNERPRKVYGLTPEGQNLLNFTEDSLNLLCKKIENINVNKLLVANGLNKRVCQTLKPATMIRT